MRRRLGAGVGCEEKARCRGRDSVEYAPPQHALTANCKEMHYQPKQGVHMCVMSGIFTPHGFNSGCVTVGAV